MRHYLLNRHRAHVGLDPEGRHLDCGDDAPQGRKCQFHIAVNVVGDRVLGLRVDGLVHEVHIHENGPLGVLELLHELPVR